MLAQNILVDLVSITLIHYFNSPKGILIQPGSTGNSWHHCLDFGCIGPTKLRKLVWQLNSLVTIACDDFRVIILVYYLYMAISTMLRVINHQHIPLMIVVAFTPTRQYRSATRFLSRRDHARYLGLAFACMLHCQMLTCVRSLAHASSFTCSEL